MLLGLAGTVLPIIPGVPLIWLGVTGYGLLDGFHHLSIPAFLVLTLLGAMGTTAEMWATQIGARAGGASGWSAAVGSCLGGLAMLFFSVPMALLTALAGVFGVEVLRKSRSSGWRQSDVKAAAQGSGGWLAGWALSAVVQFSISLFMILFFLWIVLF
jgi:uncharacterized protein YqgC (DUF456 family)